MSVGVRLLGVGVLGAGLSLQVLAGAGAAWAADDSAPADADSGREAVQALAKALGRAPRVLVVGGNERQRQTLQDLSAAFISEGFSLRTLVTDIALHPYFNADAPGTGRPSIAPSSTVESMKMTSSMPVTPMKDTRSASVTGNRVRLMTWAGRPGR